MQFARKTSLYLVAALIGVILIGAATLGSIPRTALASEQEMYLNRILAVRLASFTSPDPDPRHPANWPRVWMATLDRQLDEYFSYQWTTNDP